MQEGSRVWRRAPTQVRVSGLLIAEAGAGSWLWGGWRRTQFSGTPTEKIPSHPTPGANFQARGLRDAKEANRPVN